MPGPVFLFPLCFKEGRGGQIEGSWEFGLLVITLAWCTVHLHPVSRCDWGQVLPVLPTLTDQVPWVPATHIGPGYRLLLGRLKEPSTRTWGDR